MVFPRRWCAGAPGGDGLEGLELEDHEPLAGEEFQQLLREVPAHGLHELEGALQGVPFSRTPLNFLYWVHHRE